MSLSKSEFFSSWTSPQIALQINVDFCCLVKIRVLNSRVLFSILKKNPFQLLQTPLASLVQGDLHPTVLLHPQSLSGMALGVPSSGLLFQAQRSLLSQGQSLLTRRSCGRITLLSTAVSLPWNPGSSFPPPQRTLVFFAAKYITQQM